jgi:hypothetical protein
VLGERPMFFLDAHWLDNWPLEEEMRIITEKIPSAVILIDDFKVPGDSRFKYDKYKDKECSIELIKPQMKAKNTYNLLLPNYGDEVFNGREHPELTGYPFIFQNNSSLFNKLLKNSFVKKYFVDKSPLLKKKGK